MTPKILIIDDTPHNVKMLVDLLSAKGYATVTAASGQEGLEQVEAERPDLVLLDVMMPGMDGYEVCRRIRANPEYGILPVVMVTALDPARERIKGLDAGADDFLTKPFDRTEVLLRIKNLLDTRFLYRELERQNRSLEQVVAERTQRLLQSEKVATMGSLLAGVAHELNNPLAVVMGQAVLLREAIKEALGRARRLEPLHFTLSSSHDLVEVFGAIVRPQPLLMRAGQTKRPKSGSVRAQLVGRQ